jgi:hypothetical protein
MSTQSDKEAKGRKVNKNRRKQPKWPLIAVLLTIGILFVAGVIALYLVSRDSQIIKPEENTKFFTDSFLNLVIVVIIIVQSVIYVFQWVAMRDVIRQNERLIRASQRQARTAEKNLRFSEHTFYLAQRAYIGLESIEMAPPEDGKRLVLKFAIKNGGQTPAFNVTGTVASLISDETAISELEKQMEPFTRVDYGDFILGGSGKVAGSATDMIVDAGDLQRIADGSYCLYVRLILWFFDIQETEERSVTFWYIWHPQSQMMLIHSGRRRTQQEQQDNPN